MVQATLLDSGYATHSTSTTQVGVSLRAGYDGTSSVSDFPLNVETQQLQGGGDLHNDNAIKNDDSLSKISPVTFNNPSFSLTCSIPRESIPTTGYEYDWLYQLIRMERTKTKKVLYLDGASDRVPTLLEMYGQRYKGDAFATLVGGSDRPYVVGYVSSVSNIVISSSSNKLTFQLVFVMDDN